MMRSVHLVLSLLSLSLSACIETREDLPDEAIGLAPIYAVEDWQDIDIDGPQEIAQLGKLYYKAPFLFATERARGIHVFDNSDPTAPQPLAFLKIAGNSDLAIKGNVLYANNVSDLVAIDIRTFDSIRVLDREVEAFAVEGARFPEGYEGYFECVDEEMGVVVGWYETTLQQPKCWR
ncbi:MAG: hypothetical protein D6772_05225 [Bacteroidetes bacterium]|nr:MAG: hypothetical protein D6772_05225 [Bacteroidota bacterium]